MSSGKVDVMEVVEEANRQLMFKLDKESIKITGCDVACTFTYSALFRNNEDSHDGRNRLSLKDYCKQKDFNHSCVYEIIQEGKKDKDGNIEFVGLEWFIKEEGSANFVMTQKGMQDIYGKHDEQVETPIITVMSGSIYIDDTHKFFPSVFANILDHPSFKDCGGYNEEIKSRGLLFSKNELKLAKEANINLSKRKLPRGNSK